MRRYIRGSCIFHINFHTPLLAVQNTIKRNCNLLYNLVLLTICYLLRTTIAIIRLYIKNIKPDHGYCGPEHVTDCKQDAVLQ